ncbi:MAG: peptidyl-prolyl cis-trans isomerase [Sedimentisphaerales bacterium]|nr:peptidyl-prolyl cis-trans isomerase [Sedimentisphaerales bacterium]
MTEELNLSLPRRSSEPAGRRPRAMGILLILILAAGLANIALQLIRKPVPATTASGLSSENQKNLALKLETQGLNEPAVRAWKDYLARPGIDSEEQAKIWYRIGRMYQQDEHFEEALECYYRSESFDRLTELADEIGRRSRECLEGAGRFAALRHELANRVDRNRPEGSAGQEVVAQIGAETITQAQLDRRIEREIDRQLEALAGMAPPEELNKQKKEFLKRMSGPAERLRMLNQIVLEEVLYRRARQLQLAEKPAVRDLLADQERKLLAQSLIQSELADKIHITPADLETYYQAHKQDYLQPERAQISHIPLADEPAARELLAQLKAGRDFATAARTVSLDTATGQQGGEIPGWVAKGDPIPGIGRSPRATALIFATDPNGIVPEPVAGEQGYHLLKVRRRQPQRQKGFDQVRPEVYRALRQQKEREIQEALLAELKQEYNVVIHQSKFIPLQGNTDASATP